MDTEPGLLGDHAECKDLQRFNGRVNRRTSQNQIMPQTTNNIVTMDRMCKVSPKSAGCQSVPASAQGKVKAVNAAIIQARRKGLQNFEEALGRQKDQEERMKRAHCLKVMENVQKPPQV